MICLLGDLLEDHRGLNSVAAAHALAARRSRSEDVPPTVGLPPPSLARFFGQLRLGRRQQAAAGSGGSASAVPPPVPPGARTVVIPTRLRTRHDPASPMRVRAPRHARTDLGSAAGFHGLTRQRPRAHRVTTLCGLPRRKAANCSNGGGEYRRRGSNGGLRHKALTGGCADRAQRHGSTRPAAACVAPLTEASPRCADGASPGRPRSSASAVPPFSDVSPAPRPER